MTCLIVSPLPSLTSVLNRQMLGPRGLKQTALSSFPILSSEWVMPRRRAATSTEPLECKMNHFKSGHVRFGTQRRRAIHCDLMRRRLERSNLFLHYVDGPVSCSAVYVSQFDPWCAATKPLVSNAAVWTWVTVKKKISRKQNFQTTGGSTTNIFLFFGLMIHIYTHQRDSNTSD